MKKLILTLMITAVSTSAFASNFNLPAFTEAQVRERGLPTEIVPALEYIFEAEEFQSNSTIHGIWPNIYEDCGCPMPERWRVVKRCEGALNDMFDPAFLNVGKIMKGNLTEIEKMLYVKYLNDRQHNVEQNICLKRAPTLLETEAQFYKNN